MGGASAALPFRPYLALEADFVGGYSPTNHYSLRSHMGGLRVSKPVGKVTCMRTAWSVLSLSTAVA